jgi:hypothetical protein
MAKLKGGWFNQRMGHKIAREKGKWLGAKKHHVSMTINTSDASPPSLPTPSKPSNWLERFKEKQREKEAKREAEREKKRQAEAEATKLEILKLQLEHQKALEKMQSEKQLAELKHERDVLSGAEARRQTRNKYLKLIGGAILKEGKYILKGKTSSHKKRHKRMKK